MLRNYINIVFRNFRNQRVISLINILGLALGIAASIIIIQYVSFELNFDKFHENADRIFRPTITVLNQGNPVNNSLSISPGFGPEFKKQIPEIEDQIRIHQHTDNYTVTANPYNDLTEKFLESRIYYTDSSFFYFFSFPLIKGNPSTVLSESNSAVISDHIAEKYYGKEWRKMPDLLDKYIVVDSKDDHGAMSFKITGVFSAISNSHFQPDILLSFRTLPQKIDPIYETDNSMAWPGFYLYMQISPNSGAMDARQKIEQWFDQQYPLAKEYGYSWDIGLQPMKDIYLYSHYPDELQASGNPNLIYFLIIIALFILVVAWFNYINLTIIQAIRKIRDVGIRKTMGANRTQLIWQYLVESFIINFICIVIALIIIQFSGPLFNSITNKAFIPEKSGFVFWLSGQPSTVHFIWVIAGILVISTLISGIYPAIYLSRFKTAYMLKGWEAYTRPHKLQLRKILVTLQFMIAAIMITGTVIVFRQLTFMLGEKAGFDDEQVLIFRLLGLSRPDNQIISNSVFLKNEIRKLPMVEDVITSSSIPGKGIMTERSVVKDMEDSSPFAVKIMHVDDNYFIFYNIELLAGRQFPPGVSSDTSIANYVSIINEALMHKLDYDKPEDAIGQKFIKLKNHGPPSTKEILGVIKNYHHGSFHHEYIPIEFSLEGEDWYHYRLGYLFFPDAYTIFSIKLKTTGQSQATLSNTIQEISSLFKKTFPDMLHEYYFLDEFYNRQYIKDISYSKLITIFAVLAIFISCLGLFGLSLFIIRQRTKEIGIRKVLGASSEGLFNLLSQKYLSLVLIAGILSIPVAWWGLKQWLQQYAFRIDFQWWYFVLPILLILLIALISVGYQTIKAALANPVEALRYE